MIPEHGREMHRNCGGATRWETMGNRSAAKHLSIIELEKVSTGGQWCVCIKYWPGQTVFYLAKVGHRIPEMACTQSPLEHSNSQYSEQVVQ